MSEQSLTSTLGYLIGDSIKKMNEAESSAWEAMNRFESGGPDNLMSFRDHRKLKEQAQAHYRRLEAAHEMIADLPVETAEEAAILAVNLMGYLSSINNVEIGVEDKEFIEQRVTLSLAASETIMRFLIKSAGIDPVAIGVEYYTTISKVDNYPLFDAWTNIKSKDGRDAA